SYAVFFVLGAQHPSVPPETRLGRLHPELRAIVAAGFHEPTEQGIGNRVTRKEETGLFDMLDQRKRARIGRISSQPCATGGNDTDFEIIQCIGGLVTRWAKSRCLDRSLNFHHMGVS